MGAKERQTLRAGARLAKRFSACQRILTRTRRISDLASAARYAAGIMSAVPPDFSRPANAPAKPPQGLSMRWNALHDAAGAVAAMAGLDAEKPSAAMRGFPSAIRDAGGWKLELAEQGIADMSAMLQPGLAALLAVNARGQDATAAALTLWREFHAAREALLALVPQGGSMGPRRSA